ncbi:MarR family winged helix-turn-helix transcriptional regulator [Companilactobacillus kimchiensis]|uniref:Transcriptional regulator n=1 Tax=Companilactobacillus kimchiensis TaxID=993692 RepID=A0A0R2LBG3_9LACO|nr:MarR family transcriptional regulator [Companilactobacillus kimchiensis]KRN99019.1 transcriptional regulator [Companilactobacillus kimchiensis]
MSDLIKQEKTAGKLVKLGMLQHVSEEVSKKHPDYRMLFQGQGKILLALTEEDDLPQKELAKRLDMTAQSTAEFVRKLEKKGLVSRVKSVSDKRIIIVSLTEAGRMETKKSIQVIPEYLKDLSDVELDQLGNILDKVNDRIYEEIKSADPTLHNKYHQMVMAYLLTKFDPDDHKF